MPNDTGSVPLKASPTTDLFVFNGFQWFHVPITAIVVRDGNAGIVPEKVGRFNTSSASISPSVSTEVKLAIDDGSVPDRAETKVTNTRKSVKSPICAGSVPLIPVNTPVMNAREKSLP